MKILNPNNLPTIDYRDCQALQGNLKDLSDENYLKLKRVLDARGFTTPLILWWFEDTPYLIDGHQRHRVMMEEKMNDSGDFKVPYIKIEAENIQDAKTQLLEISSQYGTITQEGFDEFLAIDELPEAEVVETVNFDRLTELGKGGNKNKKRKLIKCPECGFEAEEKDYHKRYEDKVFQDHAEPPEGLSTES